MWLTIALGVDVVRWFRHRIPFAATRLLLFGAVYLLGEVVGILSFFVAWLITGFGLHRKMLIDAAYLTQRSWVALLLGTVRFLYRMKIEVEGSDSLGPPPGGPAIVLMQHTSLVDTLLPTTYLTARRGLKLRWVLKRELLVDPALDIGGNRLQNAFVGRDGADTETALGKVRSLAEGLPPHEGVLIYPEGTRFTPSKRARALERLKTTAPDFYARAERLKRILPPKLGGPLTLLSTAKDADVIIVGHIGFEGLATARAVLSGRLVGRTVKVRFWRIPRAEVPSAKDALVEWLWTRWEELDAWVDREALEYERKSSS